MNLGTFLKDQAIKHPERMMVSDLGGKFTYGDIEILVNKCTNFLVEKNIGKGDRVAVQLFNSVDFIVIYFATVRLGALIVPMGFMLTEREIIEILDDCRPALFFRHSSLSPVNIPNLSDDRKIIIDNEELSSNGCWAWMDNYSSSGKITDLSETDPLGILYTSGTTGKAKGILLSHGNIISNMMAAQECYQSNEKDSTILFLPLSHCFGLNAVLNCMVYSGASIHILRRFSFESVCDILQNESITLFFGVPFIYNLFLRKLEEDQLFDYTRYFFSAASKLALETEKIWHDRFGRPIYQGYGLTETSPFATYIPRDKYKGGSVGIPVKGVSIKITDENRNEVAEGRLGEIAISGPNIMLGYFNQPDITTAVIENGWFYSGDVGYMVDGDLFIVDRLKDMVIIKGENVYPSEVENIILELPDVDEVAVYGVADFLGEECVKARVVLKAGAYISEEMILNHCKKNLSNFKIPSKIIFVEALHKSPSGKLLKRTMREEDLATGYEQEATSY